jgi:hypothetical protein
VTLFVQELPSPFELYGHSSYDFPLPQLLGVGSQGAFFSFYDKDRLVLGATVFLLGSTDRDAFDQATANPRPFVDRLVAELVLEDFSYEGPPSYVQTESGSSAGISATCLYRRRSQRQAVDIMLFREGVLGLSVFYLHPIGDTRQPDIASLKAILEQKIATALDPTSSATLPPYFVETATPYFGPSVAGREVRDGQCAASFTIPYDWEALVIGDPMTGSPCAWGVRPANWASIVAKSEYMIGEYAFSLVVLNLPLEDAAPYGYFELLSGQWFVSGRQGLLNPASAVQDRGLTILRGIGAVGLQDLHGGYAGLAPLPRAAISNGVRSAVLEAGPTNIEPAFELVLQTLRFLE